MRPHELREARRSLDMTQTELGDWLGFHRKSVHNWEAGRSPIPGVVLIAVGLEIECRKLRKMLEEMT